MSFETEEGSAYGELVARMEHERLERLARDFVVLGRDALGELTHRVTLRWELRAPERA